MSIQVLTNKEDEMAVLYDSVTEIAFGPIFHEDEEILDENGATLSAEELAREFLKWCDANKIELTLLNNGGLQQKRAEFFIERYDLVNKIAEDVSEHLKSALDMVGSDPGVSEDFKSDLGTVKP